MIFSLNCCECRKDIGRDKLNEGVFCRRNLVHREFLMLPESPGETHMLLSGIFLCEKCAPKCDDTCRNCRDVIRELESRSHSK